ncbi:EVE domain-containing protein [Bacillus sp. D386]|uniref:EVE domain-containing protein n=1 Tax=Bacillus sp. D386 TaxID=2587155 RepID=UPI00111D1D84|nr:EVE domain-containing protein [Bacillus sp. D386]
MENEIKQLEMQFHKDMLGIYENAKKIGYNASRFKQMVANQGGLNVAKKFINNNEPSEGFTSLWELGRLDLTVEVLILNQKYHDLFTIEERRIVRTRLEEYGFEIKDEYKERVHEQIDKQNHTNTWIFQGNPKVFDVDNYVQNNKYIWWSLRQKHFKENIKLNDIVFIWRSDGYVKESGGIIAKTKVVALPTDETDDEGAKEYWHTEDWKNPYLSVKLEVIEFRIEKDKGFINRLSLKDNPILCDLLILRLRQQTNYLLSEEQAAELNNLWDSKNKAIHSFSWQITPTNIAIKHLDKSAFLHNGTGIPKEIRGFFKAGSLEVGKKMEIILMYKEMPFDAHIEMDFHNRTRLIWNMDFSKIIRGVYKEVYIKFKHNEEVLEDERPQLYFEKSIDNQYKLSFEEPLSLKQVQEDVEAEILEEGNDDKFLKEGKVIEYYGKRYERNPQNRKRAIEMHGLNCTVCGFNFEKVYGERGKDFIEVHHVHPISTIKKEIEINPETDLVPVCSNCHRMIHRKKNEVLSIEELKGILHHI